MVEFSVPNTLATLLHRTAASPTLKEAACRAIGTLAATTDAGGRAAAAFTAAGGMTSLADCLHHTPQDGPLGASVTNPLARAAVRAASALARHRGAASEFVRAGALPPVVHMLTRGCSYCSKSMLQLQE